MNNLFKSRGAIGILGVLLFMVAWGVMMARPVSLTNDQQIEILPGTSTRTIAQQLYDHGIIRSRLLFLTFVHLQRLGDDLHYGRYQFSNTMSMAAVINMLHIGRGVMTDITVTIPEGLRSDQIADLLVQKGVLDSSTEFLSIVRAPRPEWQQQFPFLAHRPIDQGLEGFLFGDTYRLFPNSNAQSVLTTILKAFELRIIRPNYPTLQADSSLYPTLVLASIIELEVRTDMDRMMVADIFNKRIKRGIPLQADSTVNFITGRSDERARIRDTQIASPYNTYRVPGLPPSPIANPSVSAFRAALHPRSNPYYFFLTDPSGTAHYGITYQDHQRNRSQYLK